MSRAVATCSSAPFMAGWPGQHTLTPVQSSTSIYSGVRDENSYINFTHPAWLFSPQRRGGEFDKRFFGFFSMILLKFRDAKLHTSAVLTLKQEVLAEDQ
ncbi:unnamed protein product [Calypogeia fissa]